MHLTTMNVPLRTAALGSRLTTATWSPVTNSSLAPAKAIATAPRCTKHQQSLFRTSAQKRHASTTSPLLRRSSRPTLSAPAKTTATPLISALRSASTSASSSSQSASADPNHKPLDWNTFFTLRASRRRYTLLSSILCATGSTVAGVSVLATQNLENIGAQLMGLDPIAVLVLLTGACGAAGWLVGPFLGGALWRAVHRRFVVDMSRKEKEFYERIKRFRVDPSAQSYNNPVPDYYGEKIGSVAGYRQWLKDQRAYNRKKRSFV